MTSPETEISISADVTVDSIWDEIVKNCRVRDGVRFRTVMLTGMSARVHKNRLSKLRQSRQAKYLDKTLIDLSSHKVKAIRTYAAINQEQASAAFRMTMVWNITIPVGILALLHQLLPDGLGASILRLYGNDVPALFAFSVSGIIAMTLIALVGTYAFINLNIARDIRHLIDLHAAARGIYFGLEDMDDLDLT